MDKIIIKNEYFPHYGTINYCHACLSSDRVLSTVSDYADIYFKILDVQNMVQELYLCWECIAILKKVRMLKKKVEEAQRILQFYYTNKQDTFPDALSNLTTHTTDHQICLTYQEKEIKPVKEEIDIYDEFDHFDNENIKDEPDNETNITVVDKVQTTLVTTPVITAVTTLVTTPVITAVTTPVTTPVTLETNDWMEFNLKRIKNRKAKYRFLNVKLRKHRKLLVRKIPIEFDAVLNGLEEERRSNTFLIMKYKCVSCVAAWSDEEGLAKHYKKCHDESIGPYQCGICKTRLLDNLGAHQTKHYQRECKVCRLRSCSQFAMDRHLEQHDRMVQCLACGLCFKNVRLFYNHYKELHASFVCDVCGKRCKSRAIIEKHLRYHFGYECPHCKRKLKNSTSYKNHLETHTSSVSDGSYCVQCDRRFSSDRMYRRHLQSSAAHAAERDNTRVKRKYPCPECANVYSRRTYMNNHYRHVHAKQSRYHCADCDRHFLNRTRYLDHRRFQHEGLKRDKDKLCNICGRGFAANRTLVNHIRTHSGERPFACEFCGAKFTQKHAMLSHVKYIHLKSKRKTNYE